MATSTQRDQRIWPDSGGRTAGKPEKSLCADQSNSKITKETPEDDLNLAIDITSLHFLEIGELPLLTHQEEMDLANRIELGRQAQANLITAECSAARVQLEQEVSDGLAAKDKLWVSNCRLVAAIARRHINKGVPFDDLIQEGHLGLEHAIGKFDWKRGFKFSTYAYWWIRQSVTRAIANQGRTIRVPTHTIEFMTRVFKSAEEIRQKIGSEPDINQISEYMKVPVERVEEAFRAYRPPMSLDVTSGSDDDITLANDVPGQDNTEDMGEKLHLEYEVSKKLLNNLTHRERKIIELRYGLSDGEEHTLAYVGSELGISRERVRQIETEVFIKIRSTANKEWFVDYLA
jgi:RNA polymerase primary sigma factor